MKPSGLQDVGSKFARAAGWARPGLRSGLGVPLTVPIKGSFNGAPLRVVEDTFGSGIEKVYGLGFVAPGWVAFTRFLSSTLLPFLV